MSTNAKKRWKLRFKTALLLLCAWGLIGTYIYEGYNLGETDWGRRVYYNTQFGSYVSAAPQYSTNILKVTDNSATVTGTTLDAKDWKSATFHLRTVGTTGVYDVQIQGRMADGDITVWSNLANNFTSHLTTAATEMISMHRTFPDEVRAYVVFHATTPATPTSFNVDVAWSD